MAEPSAPNQSANSKPPGREWPRSVGDFELMDRIGQGAMGTVFKARQRAMDRVVAVKVLLPHLASDAGYVERFFREARAAARLNHPNIVLAITVGEDHGYYYFAMEYVEGHTVGLLLKAGPLEERRALEIALQVARALDHAWSQERIVHRDIKPGNILITPEGTAKLADLGLAHEAVIADEGALEAGGKIVGTPFYIAPEQIQRRPDLDVRCDLYALGATLFHMVTGRPPFEGRNTKAVLAKQLHEEPPDPRELRPDLSDDAAYIIGKLLAKEREDRYADAKALVADIEKALRGDHVAPRRAPAVRVRRTAARDSNIPAHVVFTLLLVIVLIVAVVVGLRQLSRESGAGRKDGPSGGAKTIEPPDPRLAAAEKAWDEAEAYAGAHPTDPLGAIARLRDVERRFRDTPWRERAAVLRLRLEADLDRRNKEALQAIVQRADALVKETRYADALALFGKPVPGLAAEGWPERLAAARAAVERQARAAFDAAVARGDALAAKADFDEALKAYEAAGASLPDAWRAEADSRVAETRRKQKEALEQAAAQRDAAQLRTLAEVAELYRARKYDEAAQLLKSRIETAPAADRGELERELAEAARLQDTWARILRGAKDAIGKPFVIRGIQGELVAVQNGKATIRTPGGPFTDDLKSLGTEQLLALGLAQYTALDAPLAAARFLVAEGKPEAAEARLKGLTTGEAEAAALRERMRRFEAAVRLAAAAKDLKDAQKLLAAGDKDAAATALRALLARYADFPAATALRAEAQRLLKGAAAPKPPAWGHVGGRAVARPGATISNAPDPTIYLTERYGLRAYRIPLPNGSYLLRLHFAETFPGVTGVGQRVFSIAIEGRQALADLDVVKEAARQRLAAVSFDFDIEVQDGELTIEFTPKLQVPMINAIEVLAKGRARSRDILLINCGASQDYTDKAGRTWRKDQEYQP